MIVVNCDPTSRYFGIFRHVSALHPRRQYMQYDEAIDMDDCAWLLRTSADIAPPKPSERSHMDLFEEIKNEIAAENLYERLEKAECEKFAEWVLQHTHSLLLGWGLRPTLCDRQFGIYREEVRLCITVDKNVKKIGNSRAVELRISMPSSQYVAYKRNGILLDCLQSNTLEEFADSLKQRVTACIREQLVEQMKDEQK